MADSVNDLNDREKAAALNDRVSAFREEYWEIEDHWLTIERWCRCLGRGGASPDLDDELHPRP